MQEEWEEWEEWEDKRVKNLKTSLQIVQQCLGGRINGIYLVVGYKGRQRHLGSEKLQGNSED